MKPQTMLDSKLTSPECDFLIHVLTKRTNPDDVAVKYDVKIRTIIKKLGVQADIADGEVEYVVR
tara:strand:+ start:264 stop:455 length:192 start_codon:yes stop_codon:yes gene_type:complete